jgi:class 3 adenylate cyclase/tetratricopeptide (TPR) repeat protein
MSTIRQWLAGIGLEQYTEAFEREQIDPESAPYLSEENLKDLGLPMGPRVRFLSAIQAFAPVVPPSRNLAAQSRAGVDDAERRQISVLFCDLVGSTDLSHRLGPEEYRELVKTYQSACSKVISQYDGYIAQYLGDGLLVYFGYPKAHEDDVQRTVRAGLGLVEAVAELELPAGPLSVRVGIDTGLVVVGDIGDGRSQEQLALGDTPNRAARLQTLASPGNVVVTEGTRRMVAGNFIFRDLGSQFLKGIADSVHVWHALSERQSESRFEAATEGRVAPMVGRELELSVVLHAWERACSGMGQMVLLCGEPGIGKSRILQALLDKVSAKGILPWQYQCSPHFSNTALFPVTDQLERVLKFERKDFVDSKLAKLTQLLQRYGRPNLDSNLIGRLLSLPIEAESGTLAMTPQKQKEETIRALNDMLEAAGEQQPVLVLFEDLQWADPTTLELLQALLERLDRLPMLLLATYRPEFKPQWIGQHSVTALTLGRLNPEQTKAIINRVAEGRSLPAEIIAQIIAKTDGIPLFVEELTKTIVESGLLAQNEAGYIMSGPLPGFAIPTTLRDSLMARLDRLAPIKEVAQIAACIGREFDEELLVKISPLPRAQLQHALQKLIESGLVYKRGEPPNSTYLFKHALIQEAAYDSLLKSSRTQIHARVAQTLEEEFQDLVAAQPELVAHHYTAAGVPEKAIPYWHKAGEVALQRMVASDAIVHLNRAMDLIQQLPESTLRDGYELDVCTALGMAWINLQGWAHPNVVSNYERAWQLAQNLNRTDHSLSILNGQYMIRLGPGRNPDALAWAELMLSEGERSDSDEMRLVGHCEAANSYFFMGDYLQLTRHTEAVMARYDPSLHNSIPGWNLDPKTYAGVYESLAYWMLGYPDRALKTAEYAIEHARTCTRPFNLSWALQFTAKHLDVYRRDPEPCAAKLNEFEHLVHEQRIGFFEHIAGPICRAAWLLISDRPQEAQVSFADSIARWVGVGLLTDVPYFRTLHARAATLSGQLDVACNIIEQALEQIERPGWEEKGFLAEALRVKGCVLQLRGDIELAEEQFRSSLDVSRRQRTKSWELRTATSYAKFMKDQDRRKEAQQLLEPIYNWFTEGFDTKDLIDARSLLHGLER